MPAQIVRVLAVAALAASLAACERKPPSPTPAAQLSPSTWRSPTGATAMLPGEDGQWTMPAKDYASTRFANLDEINAANVANLKVAFTFSTGVNKGHEAAPVVAGDTMFVVTPFPNDLYALDLNKPGAPGLARSRA